MSEMKMTVSEMKELMDKMAQTGLGKFAVEGNGFKLSISAKKEVVYAAAQSGEAQPVIMEVPAQNRTKGGTEEPSTLLGQVVESPIVGTFYKAPAPGKDPFVTVGKKVNKGDVLFIIESMKLMNEIQSEFNGEVVEILLEDGAPVEFGQPIMVIR